VSAFGRPCSCKIRYMTNNADIKTELLKLENRYWQAMKDKDLETALSLTDFPCLIAGAHGFSSVDKNTYSKIMSSATYTVESFKLSDDAEVRMLSDNVAILAYKVHEELIVDGKPVSFDAADSSTWIKRDGRWLCAMHTESLQGDPYGRDRVGSENRKSA
jgi:hypothetical protein